jgi:hypothetical protein
VCCAFGLGVCAVGGGRWGVLIITPIKYYYSVIINERNPPANLCCFLCFLCVFCGE